MLTGYVFGSILALGGLAIALFVDRSAIMSYGVTGALGVPFWAGGVFLFLFGAVVLVRSFRLQRQK